MMPSVTAFNPHPESGKTSLVSHLAWKLAENGHSVLVVDLDPKATATLTLLDQHTTNRLFDAGRPSTQTLYDPLARLLSSDVPVATPTPHVHHSADGIAVLAGDPRIETLNEPLEAAWSHLHASSNDHAGLTPARRKALGIISIASRARDDHIVLIDIPSGINGIARSGIVAAWCILVPIPATSEAIETLKSPDVRAMLSTSASCRPSGYVRLIPAESTIEAPPPPKAMARAYRAITSDPDNLLAVDPDPLCLAELPDYDLMLPESYARQGAAFTEGLREGPADRRRRESYDIAFERLAHTVHEALDDERIRTRWANSLRGW